MSTEYIIKSLTGIKDENLIFEENCVYRKKVKYVDTIFIEAKLSYVPKCCPNCGHVKVGANIVKNGFKLQTIKLGDSFKTEVNLKLKKQRFFCKECHSSFMAETDIVNKYCHISNHIKQKIRTDLEKVMSFKEIANSNHVSCNTVIREFKNQLNSFKQSFKHLPKAICMDEFKSTKNVEGAMSFIYIDASTSEILDILPDRRLSKLESHFLRYPLEQRRKVEYVITDMYAPYAVLVKKVFPNAKLVYDKFHVINNLNRAFNKYRISFMKTINTDSHEYRSLKRYWKLILKDYGQLGCVNFRPFRCFKKWQSERSVVDHILDFDPILKESHKVLNEIRRNIEFKNVDRLKYVLESSLENSKVCELLKISIRETLKNFEYVTNMINSGFTNGRIEGINGKIKMIKRVSYGYRDFEMLRLKVLYNSYVSKVKKNSLEIA